MQILKFLVPTLLAVAQCSAIPLSFEERDRRHFLARLDQGTVEILSDRMILRDVTLRFVGAATGAHLEGLGPAAPSTYLRAGFARTFRQFPKVGIGDLYPGVDAVFYGNGDNLEYDLRVASGVSPDHIRISVEGARDIRIDAMGNLVIATASGVLQQMRPRVFQGHEISASYVLLSANQVGIRLGKHDLRLPLTIDPVLTYVNYFGGSGASSATLIATDAQGNIYAAGQSNSLNFPTTSNGFKLKVTPPLQVISNAGQSISALQVGVADGVSRVDGTPDGSVLFAVTPGGILLSGDSGATWRPTLPLPVPSTAGPGQSMTVNNIALDPLDPATILVATNLGVFGSNSGGQYSWGLRDVGLPISASGNVSVSWVTYNPVNPLIAYATTSVSVGPSSLFKSTNAGVTWFALNPSYPGEPVPSAPIPSTIATVSPDGSSLYAIDGNGILFKSLDGGASWVMLARGFGSPTAIIVDPSNANTIYISASGLQRSTDGGLTFSTIASSTNTRSIAVDSSGVLYIAGYDMVLISTDHGNTFAPVPHLGALNVQALTALRGRVYVASVSPSVPFVIKLDPSGSKVLYSTFLGGSFADRASGLQVDSQGNAVLAGYTESPDFPLTVPSSSPPAVGKEDGFVAKLSADGTQLIYSTALGGSRAAYFQAVALDSSGEPYVTGVSMGADYPTTANAFEANIPAASCPRPSNGAIALSDGYGFVSKLSADGSSRLYSTFLTGSCGSFGQGIAVDAAGDAIVVGGTASPDFPVSSGTYQSAFPGPSNQLSPPSILNAGFVSKLGPAGDKLIASSYLGGGYTTQANGVTLDASGNVFVTGTTQGIGQGPTPGAYQTKITDRCTPIPSSGGPTLLYEGTGDAFVLKLNASLSTPQFLTYLGGSCTDSGSNIALDAAGNIWVGGTTESPDFPVKQPFQGSGVGSSVPGFVSQFSADGSQLLFSSFSDSTALALGPFTVKPATVNLAGASGTSAFVAVLDPSQTPAVIIDSVGPVVTFPPAIVPPTTPGLAPGLYVQITGHNLGPATQVNAQLDSTGRLPFVLSNTTVYFNNIPAPLISVQAESILCFVPFEATSPTQITVSSNGQRSNAVRMAVSPSVPQILSAENQDGTGNSAANPAKPGTVVTLYISGLGQTNPPGDDGLVNSAPLPVPIVPVSVFESSFQIQPEFVGAAPGLMAGITQLNLPPMSSESTTLTTFKLQISVNTASVTLYYVTQ